MRRLFLSMLVSMGLLQTLPARAQVISSTDIERGLSPGAYYVPNDGMSYSQWYNYHSPSILYINGSSSKIRVWDYEDRVARALKFGYKFPTESPYREPAPVQHLPPLGAAGVPSAAPGLLPADVVQPEAVPAPKATVGVGIGGWGLFRRR
jgi:hypothetical protein